MNRKYRFMFFCVYKVRMVTSTLHMLPSLFDINEIAFTIAGYPLSYVELIGTVFGMASVWFSTRQSILTWPSGIINIIFFIALFYQVQLYADVLLQLYYFGMNIYGWFNWKKQFQQHQRIVLLSNQKRIQWSLLILLITAVSWWTMSHIHQWLPKIFTKSAAYPLLDSAIAVMSIIAMVFMAKRILENWILWLLVNILCVYVYSAKQILFTSVEYGLFFILALVGFYRWQQSLQHYKKEANAHS